MEATYEGQLHNAGVNPTAGYIVVETPIKTTGVGTLADPLVMWTMRPPTNYIVVLQNERFAREFAIKYGWTAVWIRHHLHRTSRYRGPGWEKTGVLDRIYVDPHMTLYLGMDPNAASRQGDLYVVEETEDIWRVMRDEERRDKTGQMPKPLRGIDFFIYPKPTQLRKIQDQQLRKIHQSFNEPREQSNQLDENRIVCPWRPKPQSSISTSAISSPWSCT